MLVDKSIFNEYFECIDEIKSLYEINGEINDLYEKIEKCMNYIKEIIRNEFEKSLNNNEFIELDKEYHRLTICVEDDCNTNHIKTKWIKTKNKIKLYYHLLFTNDFDFNFLEFIDIWFIFGYGYYPEYNKINEFRLLLDNHCNINIIREKNKNKDIINLIEIFDVFFNQKYYTSIESINNDKLFVDIDINININI
jgi:hypothetical protein